MTSFKQNEMKPAYCLFENVNITDSAKLEEYKKNVFPVVEKFGGKYIVASGQIRNVEGDWNPQVLVMIQFSTFEQANKWYDSEDYKELKTLRRSSGEFNAVIMEAL
ncbi:conserved hypothetical protein [Tenacibaculum sediminilitoris]|uniref:DUF1330 domain-containing protein n=1 Tax=Tenacibaculum sediminilitoris TaxID=1820334 RepID=UPI003892F6E2